MSKEIYERIRANPDYHRFVRKRNIFSLILAIAGAVAYYSFILLIAFNKSYLAQRVGSGVISLGIYLGLGVIIFTIVITWIYVLRANSKFDPEMEQIVEKAKHELDK